MIVLGTTAAVAVAAAGEVGRRTRSEAHRLLTNPLETRKLPTATPIDFGMVYDDVAVTTPDGLRLVGWFVPSENGVVIIAQHGYKSDRSEMLNEAAMLHRHGYGVLIPSVRTHDLSDGTLITFGKDEMQDLEAWLEFLRSPKGGAPSAIGMLGNSFGGTLAIQLAATHPEVEAVVTNSAFSSLDDTIETSIRFFTRLPPFPFAPLVAFWAEREAEFAIEDVDAKKWIPRLSPRPVFLMQGGRDVVISRESGRLLYEAAGEPRVLWEEPEIGHAEFDRAFPAEYERRVVAFFDEHLKQRGP
jgi:fermentation-respiration switch protein FrsA (DUF1100 family)